MVFASGGVVGVLLSCLDPNEKQPDETGKEGPGKKKGEGKGKRERAQILVSLRETKLRPSGPAGLPSLFPFCRPRRTRMRYDDDSLTGLESHQRGRKPGGAIYHMKVRTGSRGGGQSARACAAYIERAAEYGREADKAAELVYTESGHMPEWANAEAGGLAYWDAADLYERSNGRLYKSIEIALPLALDPDQQRDLAVNFAHSLTDADQLPYTLAIHAGKGENPHCHLMISERANDQLERSPEHWFKRYNAAEPEAGGAQKSTALKPKEWLLETRAAWAEQTNAALKEAGLEIRIDHRSLEAQGIERVPGIHLGPAAAAMEARGELSERGNRQAEINQLNEQLTALEKEIEYERQRQRDLEPRPAQAEAHREAEAEHHPRADRAAAIEPAHRDAEGASDRGYHRDSGLSARGRGVAGGDQPAPRGALPRGEGAERGAAGERGGGVEAGAGGMGAGESPGSPLAQGDATAAEQSGRGPRAAPSRVGVGMEPGSFDGDAARGGVKPGADRDLSAGWPAEPGAEPGGGGAPGGGGGAGGDSAAMGHGDDSRAKENPGASGEQDRRAVDAAAVTTAQAQLAAAEAAIERAVRQLAEADERLERQAEQQRARELEAKQAAREAEWERRERAEEKGLGLGD